MNEATQTQIRAAEPTASTWLSANAGSGKTRVLTDRVARLLLRGVEPQRILCLTYTKAAASEMQNRLFSRLGEWAMLEPGALAAQLQALGEIAPGDTQQLARARRLFARAIEAPGGLRIQTIHAFCSALLRRFPLEAGVSPDFSEIDERSLRQLRNDVLDQIAAGPDAARLFDLASAVNETALGAILDEIGKYRDVFSLDAPEADLDDLFGLPAGFGENALIAEVFQGDEAALARDLVPPLSASGPSDRKLAEALAKLEKPSLTTLIALEGVLLFGATATKSEPFSAKVGQVPTKAQRGALPYDVLDRLDALMLRVEAARPRRLALAALGRSRALHRFARCWIPALETAKARRGWLDFDDLILRARRLLSNPAVAQWVLFKLDGGIDHILVDEAQDTSPTQWEVIELLAQEFTAGHGARDVDRTIFVVGDKKQSIYSFQGADLRGFDRVRARFEAALDGVGQRLNPMELLYSFRSSDAILRLVDQCFAPGGADEEAGGELGGQVEHLAFHPRLPGRVDLWVPVPRAAQTETGAWDEPLDRPGEQNHEILLARQVAAEIHAMIERGECIDTGEGPRRLHEGDFLILVRRRKLLFNEIIRACKALGLEVAGADRLRLGDELPVQDIVALLRFLALPEDDLSLAVALRSPLFGLSEDQLFRLAHGRGRGFLWERLRAAGEHAPIVAILSDLLDQTDFLRPYELIERLLTRHDGRRRLMARFGVEAEDAIEALVTLALGFESDQVPTLDGFLEWLAASDAEIKRQSESAGRRIRVMTVHGAKGLEAPVVIVPDTADRRDPERASLADVAGQPILRVPAGEAPAVQAAADEAQARMRRDEASRLLYVALTRAQSWLIVAGAGDCDGVGWYGRVQGAMARLGATPFSCGAVTGWRFQHGVWPDPAGPATGDRPRPRREAPVSGFAVAPPPASSAIAAMLSPSGLGGDKALAGMAGDDEETALARGSLIHLLLEHLPAVSVEARAAEGQRLLDAAGAPAGLGRICLDEALQLLADPALAPLFGAEALTEVALSGTWNDQPIWGIIDRLLIDETRVLAVDFKSNRVIPDAVGAVPEGLLRQIGAYALMLRALFPDHRIETALLWTMTGSVMVIPEGLALEALARAALDPERSRP